MAALGGAFACLRDYGMRIALDDYGVGNSNLQLWAEMQPDLVKIDRYFFRGIGQDDRKQNMVRAILKVAQHLGTAIVAEGIRRPRTWPWCASWTSATPRAGCWAAPKALLTELTQPLRDSLRVRTPATGPTLGGRHRRQPEGRGARRPAGQAHQ